MKTTLKNSLKRKIPTILVILCFLATYVSAAEESNKLCPIDSDFKYALKKAILKYVSDPPKSELSKPEIIELINFYLSHTETGDADCSNVNKILDKTNQLSDDLLKKSPKKSPCLTCSGIACGENNAVGQKCECNNLDKDSSDYEICKFNPITPKIIPGKNEGRNTCGSLKCKETKDNMICNCQYALGNGNYRITNLGPALAGGECTQNSNCAGGQYCDIDSKCQPKKINCESCGSFDLKDTDTNTVCASEKCEDGLCQPPTGNCPSAPSCPDNVDCSTVTDPTTCKACEQVSKCVWSTDDTTCYLPCPSNFDSSTCGALAKSKCNVCAKIGKCTWNSKTSTCSASGSTPTTGCSQCDKYYGEETSCKGCSNCEYDAGTQVCKTKTTPSPNPNPNPTPNPTPTKCSEFTEATCPASCIKEGSACKDPCPICCVEGSSSCTLVCNGKKLKDLYGNIEVVKCYFDTTNKQTWIYFQTGQDPEKCSTVSCTTSTPGSPTTTTTTTASTTTTTVSSVDPCSCASGNSIDVCCNGAHPSMDCGSMPLKCSYSGGIVSLECGSTSGSVTINNKQSYACSQASCGACTGTPATTQKCSDGTVEGVCSTVNVGKRCTSKQLVVDSSCSTSTTCNDGTVEGACSTVDVGKRCTNKQLVSDASCSSKPASCSECPLSGGVTVSCGNSYLGQTCTCLDSNGDGKKDTCQMTIGTPNNPTPDSTYCNKCIFFSGTSYGIVACGATNSVLGKTCMCTGFYQASIGWIYNKCSLGGTGSSTSCVDDGFGTDNTRKGTATLNGVTKTDACEGTQSVHKYFCNADKTSISENTLSCQTGYVCSEGACVQNAPVSQKCVDSDNGDPYILGYVDFLDRRTYDYCNAYNTRVIEYYCSGNDKRNREVQCPNGCLNGACISTTTTTTTASTTTTTLPIAVTSTTFRLPTTSTTIRLPTTPTTNRPIIVTTTTMRPIIVTTTTMRPIIVTTTTIRLPATTTTTQSSAAKCTGGYEIGACQKNSAGKNTGYKCVLVGSMPYLLTNPTACPMGQ